METTAGVFSLFSFFWGRSEKEETPLPPDMDAMSAFVVSLSLPDLLSNTKCGPPSPLLGCCCCLSFRPERCPGH